MQELQFWWNLKLYTNRRPWIQWWQNCLWFLTPVNIDNCRYWYLSSFRPQFWTKNGKPSNFDKILYFAQTKGGEFNDDNSYLWFLMPVNIGTCYLLGHSFWPKMSNAPVLMKFCTLHKTKVVNSMVSILTDASGCRRELKLGIEKQILCQKCYCYIINKTAKKLWLTSVKLFS